jgi:uncharacterized protein YkwD
MQVSGQNSDSRRVRRAFACLLVVAGLTATGALGGTATATRSLDASILGQINAVRTSRGLAPLRPDPGLQAAAAAHSREMLRAGYFAHESPDGSPFWRRIERSYGIAGFHAWAVGENLATASPSLDASTLLRLWLASPPHRKNLLEPNWRQIGIAAVHVQKGPGVYGDLPATVVTADFGVRA